MRSSSRAAALALALVLLLAGCGIPRPEQSSSRPGKPARPTAPVRPQGPVADSPVKIGKPYQVAGVWYYPADDSDYDEVGLASWYGAQFHGGQTANGERFDMDRFGAAHKTLPLPSYVEVTAIDSGRTIVVRINDRGPFVANRIIDLSRRSAQLLGVERSGVSRVRVRRVYPADADRLALRSGRAASERPYATNSDLALLRQRLAARPSDPVAPPRVAAAVPVAAVPVGGWFIQLAALSSRDKAEEIAEFVAGRVEQAGSLWRVRMGPYKNEPEATSALAQVQSDGYQDARLVFFASNSKIPEGTIPQ
ncbi:septal ring lytic transglycosylase RlpA family protein [Sphingomonas sp. SRS2]|uniref:septal ring lytic transglycosylase RlpA family protein n=1 Tax=Sphingomonas sp. SRS2 TaxID=133190 RepID=UPI0006183F62|nr:septal ring lytic transglycosylase RlpA family protein [Sphingomonas sp. SRS2]KKC27485.1 rare lipoprotein A [Sphingomonas sp. SRS2]